MPNKEKIIIGIISILLGIGGFVLIGIYGSWLLALGVFLCIWGNNLGERHFATLVDPRAYK